MSYLYNLAKIIDRKNMLNVASSFLDSNNTSASSTVNEKKKKKCINKKVIFKGVEIIEVESYKLYNQKDTSFESLESNTVESCNCNVF